MEYGLLFFYSTRKYHVTLICESADSYRAKKRSAMDVHSREQNNAAYAAALGAENLASEILFYFAGHLIYRVIYVKNTLVLRIYKIHAIVKIRADRRKVIKKQVHFWTKSQKRTPHQRRNECYE